MTQPPPLVDSNGRPYPLDRQIGSGGEGAVFAVANDPNRVAKVYHNPPPAETVDKLKTMLALAAPGVLRVATWPVELLFDARSRRPAGFAMPRLVDYQEIWHLYHPVERLKCFARASWRFQIRAAKNLAAAFDEVHKTGCVIGDVQLRNAHVSQKAEVRLVDCDSFQILANGKQYLCAVGLPHYIPPELQGKSLRGLVRTENHDRFGMAVLLYQLLFVGRHPYAGVYNGSGDPSFQQLITEFRFAQGPLAMSWGMNPPPHTPTFADIPPDVAMLFRRAFERGGEKGTRPRAPEWLPVLDRLEQNLAECAVDPGHVYWKGAGRCVWCRIAERGGPEYYFGVAGGTSTFAVDEAKLQDVLRRLANCGTFEFQYDRNKYLPTAASEPEPLPPGLVQHRTTLAIVGTAAALCAVLIPFGIFRGFFCAIGALGALVFGTWLVVLLYLSPWQKERRHRRRSRDWALKELRDIEDEWYHWVDRYHRDDAELGRSIRRLASECRSLASHYQAEVQRLTANAERAALLRHLRLHLIADNEIPMIGPGRQQLLAAHSVFTAADIDRHAIRAINGFGEALTNILVAWKEDVEAKFRFNAASAVSPGESRAVTVKLRVRQQQIFSELDQKLRKLEALGPACRKALQKLVPRLLMAVAAWDQAEADVRLMGKA
jgi:DNA-binding helix-hairpin-helix protein with protein kinase domain